MSTPLSNSDASLTINILTRTGRRPVYFSKLYQSIQQQSYRNIHHIISNDNPKCNYLNDVRNKTNTSVLTVTRGDGDGFYNIYLNQLASKAKNGWVIILDDDSYIINDSFIEELAKRCEVISPNDVLIFQSYIFPHRRLIPKQHHFAQQKIERLDFDMACFCVHTSVFNHHKFTNKRMGDYNFMKRLEESGKYNLVFSDLPPGIWANYDGAKHGK